MRCKPAHVPKKQWWAHILPEKLAAITEKVQLEWDVEYVDGSRKDEGGVNFARYGVWFGPDDERNEETPLVVHEKQTITRAELTAALQAIKNIQPGKPLLIVSDSELVCVGLQSKCEKWARHKWVGSRGPLAHKYLWTNLWGRWQLLGDSVEILWVPSHVGVVGNEEADSRAAKGAKQA